MAEVAPTDEKIAACSHEWVKRSYECTTAEDNEKLYDEWAKVYDSTMDPDTYRAPFGVLEHVQKKKLMATTDKVLDVGCGTGLLGHLFHKAGYENLHGMDQSQGMLDVSDSKKIYSSLTKASLGTGKLPFESNTFDGAISSGVFTPGHAPASSLREVAEIVKKGGIICYTLKLDLYESSDYKIVHKELEDSKVWEDAGHSEPYSALPGDQASDDCMLRAFTWRVL